VEKPFNRLCEVLDAELERQELVLAVLRAQRDAILTRDLEYLEAKTEALNALVREVHQAQGTRLVVLRDVVTALDLALEQQTMTGLILMAHEPWQSRLRELQKQLRAAALESRSLVRSNAVLLRRSMQVVNKCLDSLQQCEAAAEYNSRGGEPQRARRAALIDQKG
jgi:flagellar biosynthesis/type III secretory pathway chaperone